MTTSFRPAQTGFSRVFLIDGRARPDHRPEYQSNMKAGSISQSFGDVEKIEVPSPDEYGKFEEVGVIRGAVERATITLTGRYAADLKSEMLRLARKNCAVDVHIDFGACTDPSDYNVFTKKIILEDAIITSYDTEDLGALASDEAAKVDESIEVSAVDVYEIVPLTFTERAGDIITNELVDVTICGIPSCGDCDDESEGCDEIYAISIAAGGSPGTPADIVYSKDEGLNFYAHDIDTMGATDVPDAVDCLGAYVFVISEDTNSIHYALRTDFAVDGSVDPDFTEVSTGFVTGGEPLAVHGTKSQVWIVGNGGYIYNSEDVTAGVTVQDAGVATTDDLNDVHAFSEEYVVAVGNNGAIVKTTNGDTWTSVTGPSNIGAGEHLAKVWMKSKNVWIILTVDGRIYYTLDAGTIWTQDSFPGSGSGNTGSGTCYDIMFANDTVGYLAHTTAAGVGRILRTTNGGYDWVVLPEGVGSLPANDRVRAVAACRHDPDFVVGAGLGDNGTDGYLVIGTQ